jgi:putative transposase
MIVGVGNVKLTAYSKALDSLELKNSNIYTGYRYPFQIISYAVWLYHRFTLSFCDIENLLVAKGITTSYETIRKLRKQQQRKS